MAEDEGRVRAIRHASGDGGADACLWTACGGTAAPSRRHYWQLMAVVDVDCNDPRYHGYRRRGRRSVPVHRRPGGFRGGSLLIRICRALNLSLRVNLPLVFLFFS